MRETIDKETVVKRALRNPNGDWNKLETLTKEIIKQGQLVENLCEKLAEADNRLKILCRDAYALAPAVDCVFMDSPIAPHKHTFFIKAQLKKAGWDGIRDVSIESIMIEPFSKIVKDGCKWLLKFKDDQNS